MLDSVIRVSKKYKSQTLLGECKYEMQKKTKIENLINDDLDLRSSSDKSDNETDNESDNKADIGPDNE